MTHQKIRNHFIRSLTSKPDRSLAIITMVNTALRKLSPDRLHARIEKTHSGRAGGVGFLQRVVRDYAGSSTRSTHDSSAFWA